MTIMPGDKVFARSSSGRLLERRAISEVMRGRDFPVVWVVREADWQAAQATGVEPEGLPWPAEDVLPAAKANA